MRSAEVDRHPPARMRKLFGVASLKVKRPFYLTPMGGGKMASPLLLPICGGGIEKNDVAMSLLPIHDTDSSAHVSCFCPSGQALDRSPHLPRSPPLSMST